MSPYLTLALGVLSAGLGGELFVRGTVSLATWARIAPGIVGATVAAFATSSPELSVSITSALAGTPQIALGDALGSNVVNIALILALALLISGIQSSRDSIRRDFPVAFLVPVLTAALAADGELSRLDGSLMLSVFLTWMIATVIEARRQRSAAEEVLGAHRLAPALVSAAIGLALLVGAGLLIVDGARAIATSFGLSEFIIGATVVAVGTSVPELATALISKLRGHDEVGLGTVLGSNIFNGLFIVAVAALIHPIAFEASSVRVALAFGLVAVMLTLPGKSGYIGRG
ncbi:MAG TPA: calcium/sodium antiporter, partial [Burkholderiaceae bacterium]|nr:calcium/sodium antiporter [Burkholderiaceae bacterium]